MTHTYRIEDTSHHGCRPYIKKSLAVVQTQRHHEDSIFGIITSFFIKIFTKEVNKNVGKTDCYSSNLHDKNLK
ncbi:hypothetical protein BXY75_0936 [Ulvibacter antarcticus]|uniref:Uncharacterized protein n=1 Tax=Ulvibacter antarcticus TaxID=442714 RepID=A0A3L9Z2Y2_9FLAO|nr:hypothetical protein BXY75_0936 [Ulvibacter antarcticus]